MHVNDCIRSEINVVKRDGSTAPYDGYEIARSIEEASRGLDDSVTRATQIQSELEITLFDQITSEQLDEAVIQVALGNVKDDPAFDTIAARLMIKTLYKKVLGEGVDRDTPYATGTASTSLPTSRGRWRPACSTPGWLAPSTWWRWPAPSTPIAIISCATSGYRPCAPAT